MDAEEQAKTRSQSLRLKGVGTGTVAQPVQPAGTEDYDQLLLLLDPDLKIAGKKYSSLRVKLILFFDCRRCPDADFEADEVIGRTARKVSSEAIEDIHKYVAGVARLRFHEIIRERKREPDQADDLDQIAHGDLRSGSPFETPDERLANEIRLECLEACMRQLRKDDRELMRDYYREDKRQKIDLRQELAGKYHMSGGALRTHLCRLRKQLAQCCHDCIAKKAPMILKQS
jgi:DNA-directed RNA polymerase specialized sigma24 family protein